MKEKLTKRLKETKGITLVALVVTIIVLLILSGVTLGLVFNSDGLFSKANDAASRYNESKEDEERYLQGAEGHFDRYNGIYGGSTTGTPTDTPASTATVTPTPEPTPTLPAVGEAAPEAGWTVEQAKGLVARDGLQAHIGEKVQYSPAGAGVYRIFYYDNEINSEDSSKGYFGDQLGTLYLKRDFKANDTRLEGHQSHTPSDGGIIMKKMNPKWKVASNGSLIDSYNEHCVAWLCDPGQWTKYKVDNVANYVIGSPSVEMYMKAFNVYKDNNPNSTTLINKIGNTGYSVGAHNSYTWNNSTEDYTGNGSIEAGPNNIFMTAGSYYWWLASPSAGSDNYVLSVDGRNAYVRFYGYHNNYGVCPIVSIIK